MAPKPAESTIPHGSQISEFFNTSSVFEVWNLHVL